MLKRIYDAKIDSFKVASDADETSPIIKMLAKDQTDSYESALKDFYRKIRPGEPATIANARSAMMRLFFDPKRYNLGRVGRYKLNSKLGMPLLIDSSGEYLGTPKLYDKNSKIVFSSYDLIGNISLKTS